ncbi:Uncharacterized protein TCM_045586 [Theobroma cacao]|uniref:Uncharacterized protein n=1 Tax=Theobroma cacao TaxID=3641 RepID=A0A061FTC1_THECC|nr:Uncharacterized protein TCM_045586 [Theobroma cacao]
MAKVGGVRMRIQFMDCIYLSEIIAEGVERGRLLKELGLISKQNGHESVCSTLSLRLKDPTPSKIAGFCTGLIPLKSSF